MLENRRGDIHKETRLHLWDTLHLWLMSNRIWHYTLTKNIKNQVVRVFSSLLTKNIKSQVVWVFSSLINDVFIWYEILPYIYSNTKESWENEIQRSPLVDMHSEWNEWGCCLMKEQ